MNDIIKSINGLHFRHGLSLILWLLASGLVMAALLLLGGILKDVRSQTVEKRAGVAKMEAEQKHFAELKSTIQGIEDKQSRLSILLPTRRDVLRNIELLELLSSTTSNTQKIEIKELPPGSARKVRPTTKTSLDVTLPDRFDKVDYFIKLEGGFNDLMKYLQALENQPFLTVVKSITLEAETIDVTNEKEVNTGIVRTTINGTFYYVKE